MDNFFIDDILNKFNYEPEDNSILGLPKKP